MSSFQERMVAAMEHANVSREGLASEFGVTRSAVGHWIYERRSLGKDEVAAIADYLGVRPAWLAYDDGPMLAEPVDVPPPPVPGPVKTRAVKAKARRKPAPKSPRRKAA